MRKCLLLLLLFCLVAVSGLSAAEKEVRYLTFSVKNRFDFFVRDLRLEEVELKIDGRPVDIGFLGSKDIDTAYVILLENSPRTAKFPVSMPQHGRVNLIDQMRYQMSYNFFGPLVRSGSVLLGEFFRRVKILHDFSSREDALVNALHNLSPNFNSIDMDSTRVGHALGRGVDLLKQRPEKRKVLVLFTASIDRESYNHLDEYKDMLRLTDVELYAITSAPRFAGGSQYTFQEKMSGYFLRQLAAETSGYAYVIKEFVYYDELFTDLVGRMTNTYTIGFYIYPGPEAESHKISLKINREKCKVNCRKSLVF